MTVKIPVKLTWVDAARPYLETEQDLLEFYNDEDIRTIKFILVPSELLQRWRQLEALLHQLRNELREIENADREVLPLPTKEDRNNKRRLAKRGGK